MTTIQKKNPSRIEAMPTPEERTLEVLNRFAKQLTSIKLSMEVSKREMFQELHRVERKVMERVREKEWLTKTEALAELGCKSSKLYHLCITKKVRTNEEVGRGKKVKYSLKSIRQYLANPHYNEAY